LVEKIFHLGGEVDFDNAYRWLAPWSMLERGKILVVPARRRFRGRRWARIEHRPLRSHAAEFAGRASIEEWLAPFHNELTSRPLYISLDKDVLLESEAVVNWDSGHLTTPEVLAVLEAFVSATGGELAGMDVVGDWSTVRLQGLFRRLFHWTEHPSLTVDAEQATRRNETWNVQLVDHLLRWSEGSSVQRQPAVGFPLTAG
jgi:hypothetical protein